MASLGRAMHQLNRILVQQIPKTEHLTGVRPIGVLSRFYSTGMQPKILAFKLIAFRLLTMISAISIDSTSGQDFCTHSTPHCLPLPLSLSSVGGNVCVNTRKSSEWPKAPTLAQ